MIAACLALVEWACAAAALAFGIAGLHVHDWSLALPVGATLLGAWSLRRLALAQAADHGANHCLDRIEASLRGEERQ
jgi:hypothetical protein